LPEKDTKTAHMAVIKKYLKQDNAASQINLQAAIGIDRNESGSDASRRKMARMQFFHNSGASEVEQHYLDFFGVLEDAIEQEP
jgi:hypothetical protein